MVLVLGTGHLQQRRLKRSWRQSSSGLKQGLDDATYGKVLELMASEEGSPPALPQGDSGADQD